MGHIPVLFQEVMQMMAIQAEGIYVDCTLGGGGHTRGILERLGSRGKVIALEQDPETMVCTQSRLKDLGNQVVYIRGNFRYLKRYLDTLEIKGVNGVLFDLGVSSFQLDQKERGFSFHAEADLDMRMDPTNPYSAKALVNEATQQELTRFIREYGEERWAQRIAHFIVRQREQKPITTTLELVEVIKAAIPAAARRKGPHPARRTFQVLRIAVNDELGALRAGLEQAITCLAPRGRMCIISFHSLEDRIVKRVLREGVSPCICPVDFPECRCGKKPLLHLLNRRPIQPGAEELKANSRARSARLRGAERI